MQQHPHPQNVRVPMRITWPNRREAEAVRMAFELRTSLRRVQQKALALQSVVIDLTADREAESNTVRGQIEQLLRINCAEALTELVSNLGQCRPLVIKLDEVLSEFAK